MTTLNTIPRISKRAISLILFVQVLVFAVFIAPLNVSAYSRDGNKLNPNYSLTGNGASDIVAVAKAQLGKKYTDFSGFTYRAWCADFVSACAAAANQSNAIPGNASVSGIRSSIKKAGGVEYSKSTIQNRKYVPKRGDIIIFKSSGDSHVGIVDYTSGSSIYYIDGNNTSNGNGNNACVHYSNRTFNYKGFTCVISPNYKNQNSARKSYNDVFASTKGSGYSLNQAKASASSTFTTGQFVYVWGYLHDVNNNLYKSYGSGSCNLTISIYRPDGSCAHTYTYNNSDNNWIGQKLDKIGTWKIRSQVSGSLSGINTQTITVKPNDPSGELDAVQGGEKKIYVAGWAVDSNNYSRKVKVHVYIGKPANKGGKCYAILEANKKRTDVGKKYPSAGDYHGFDAWIPTDLVGKQKVYVYAIGTNGASNTLLTPRDVQIKNVKTRGVLEKVVGQKKSVRVTGWAFGENTSKASEIHVYIGGPAGAGGKCSAIIKANKSRKDVHKVHGCGNYHGFDAVVKTNLTGKQSVYVYAIHTNGDGNILLGNRTVTISK